MYLGLDCVQYVHHGNLKFPGFYNYGKYYRKVERVLKFYKKGMERVERAARQ
jgi:hypothetical protein